jgi:hypothetical protein
MSSCRFFVIPEEYTFDEVPFQFDTTSFLDTNAFYYHDYGRTDRGFDKIHLLSFSNNGTLMWLNCDSNCYDKDSLKKMTFNEYRYRIEEDRIELEVYEDSYHGFAFWSGVVYQDSIVFDKFKGRAINTTYYKLK